MSERYHAYLSAAKEENAVITADISFAAAAMPPAIRGKAVYTFFPDGRVEIAFSGDVTENAQPLPRFGLKFSLIKDFEDVEYYGYGPKESYSDRYKAMHLGRFNSTVSDEYENYVNPRESSAHYKTKYAALRNSEGDSIEFYDKSADGFSFKAIHFSDVQMDTVKHHDELIELDETIVNINTKMLILIGTFNFFS